MNQINEIVLETIRDINNAHTLQQVEAALNNGIARISAVQIVILIVLNNRQVLEMNLIAI